MQLYYIYLGTLKSTDAWFHLQDSDLTGRSRDSLVGSGLFKNFPSDPNRQPRLNIILL